MWKRPLFVFLWINILYFNSFYILIYSVLIFYDYQATPELIFKQPINIIEGITDKQSKYWTLTARTDLGFISFIVLFHLLKKINLF